MTNQSSESASFLHPSQTDEFTNQSRESTTFLRQSQTDDFTNKTDVIIIAANIFLLPFIILSKIALTRTKKIPNIAKFLLNGLLTFDFFANLCFFTESMITDDITSKVLILIGAGIASLSYITGAMLPIDRLVAFQFPYQYLNFFVISQHKPQIVAVICWSWVFSSHTIHRVILCTSDHITTNATLSTNSIVNCSFIIKWSNTSIIIPIFVIVISMVCYILIFRIVKQQAFMLSRQTKQILKHYKTTTVIVIYMINILTTALAYTCMAIISVDPAYSKPTIKFVVLLNGIFNSCAYVLWFKECQMEFLKLFVSCVPKLRAKTDRMKVDIFLIPTVDKV